MATTKKARTKTVKAKAKAKASGTAKKPASKTATSKVNGAAKRTVVDGDARITLKTKENPYSGSRAERFALLRDGMTRAEYVRAVEAKGYPRSRAAGGLRIFLANGHIAVGSAR